jgi:hypothetical protein
MARLDRFGRVADGRHCKECCEDAEEDYEYRNANCGLYVRH